MSLPIGMDGTTYVDVSLLLKVSDLETLLSADRRTIYRMCKRGQLPRPFKLGATNRWKARDILAFIDEIATDEEHEELVPTLPTDYRERVAEAERKGVFDAARRQQSIMNEY